MGRFKPLQKWRWANQASKTPLAELYQSQPQSLKTPWDKVRFLVVDCEMSGLDPQQAELISIGWVAIEEGQINYASRKHLLLHAKAGVGASIKIHGLFDHRLAGASSVASVLGVLAKETNDSVLVFHHAVLDLAFLQKAAMSSFACPLRFRYIDTMHIEKRRLERQGKTASLQLNLCRDRYGLPKAFEHDAMYDAIATAELLLAQIAHMGGREQLKLRDLKPEWA